MIEIQKVSQNNSALLASCSEGFTPFKTTQFYFLFGSNYEPECSVCFKGFLEGICYSFSTRVPKIRQK